MILFVHMRHKTLDFPMVAVSIEESAREGKF
jgi:hypothetical protein